MSLELLSGQLPSSLEPVSQFSAGVIQDWDGRDFVIDHHGAHGADHVLELGILGLLLTAPKEAAHVGDYYGGEKPQNTHHDEQLDQGKPLPPSPYDTHRFSAT